MTRNLSGYPFSLYTKPRRADRVNGISTDVINVFLPPNGETLILDNETRAFKQEINMRVHHISVDIPAGMVAELLLDSAIVHETTDGKGQAGGIPISLPGLPARQAHNAATTITNTSGEDLNAKYIITGVAI